MNYIIQRKYSQKKKEKQTIASTKTIIEKYFTGQLETSSNINNEIKENILNLIKIIEYYESFYKIQKIKKFFDVKYKRTIELIKSKKQLKMKKNSANDKKINKSIICISIIMLKIYVNNNKHDYIKEYIMMLLFLIKNDILNLDNFMFIIKIILLSILDLLSNINGKNFQKYSLKNDYLLFINDIVETIINNSFDMRNDIKFISELFKLFNHFFELAKKENIFIENDELWLKLLEDNNIIVNNLIEKRERDNTSLKQIQLFLLDIYTKNIPKNFYDEIYKKSSIDLYYYINILDFLNVLFKLDNEFNTNIGFNIKSGIIFYGNTLFYKNININSETEEFSFIFSFKINEIRNNEDIIIFNLTQIRKNSSIRIIIDNNQNLIIVFNKDSKWNTNIVIDKGKDYLVCLVYDKTNKITNIYINTDKTSKTDINPEKHFLSLYCFKYSFKKLKFPIFSEKMDMQLGKKNFYGVLGDILLINSELEDNDIAQIFNSNDYYSDLIYSKNINNSLIKDKIKYSRGCTYGINNYKNLKYEFIFRITRNSFINDFKEKNIYEYEMTNSLNIFVNKKGVEFLIFMLHNINSKINDNKTLNMILYKTIDFIYNITLLLQEQKNKIIIDDYSKYCAYFEIDEEKFTNQTNLFFLSLLSILIDIKKSKDFKLSLSDDIRKLLNKYLEIKFDNSIFHIIIISGILLDNELFNQKKYITELNDFLSKKLNSSFINRDIIYKILLLDYILEMKNIKHKIYCNYLGEIFYTKNNIYFCNLLINYIIKIQSEIKIYHYLKIIYYNIDQFKILFEKTEENQFNLYSFIQKKFETLNKDHCKYCSYIIVLCFLIKERIWNEKSDSFTYNTFGYMTSPSFLFIRSIFIESFNLKNYEKFKFIKLKPDAVPYNLDFFDSIKKNPIEICKVGIFNAKLNSLIKYLTFLLNIEKKDDNLKKVISNFFPFILELFEKMRVKKYLKGDEQKKKIVNYTVRDLFSTKIVAHFFVLYFKFNREKAMTTITNYIKSPLIKIINPFFFYLINSEVELGDKNITSNIKLEIIKTIIVELINMQKETENIYSLLVLIHRNIFEEKIEQLSDFPMVFFSYYVFISNQELFLHRRPLDLNFFSKKGKKSIYLIQENKKNIKFISEIIIEIIFKFFLEGHYNNSLMISSFLIKEKSSTVFYFNDENFIRMKKTNTVYEIKSKIFKNEFNYFLYTLYFLIIFLNILRKYPNCAPENKKIVNNLIEILFNDLNKIYANNKKLLNVLKKVDNYGPNFHLYNKMLNFCNKNYKDHQKFNLKSFKEKLESINKNEEFEILQYIGIESLRDINIENTSNTQKYKIVRSKSFDKIITNSMKEKYLENPKKESTFLELDFEENNLNQTMYINMTVDLNGNITSKNGNRTASYTNMNIKDLAGENFLKNKLSKKNVINGYYKQIINELDPIDIKMLLNPKEYFLWKNFTVSFKDFIFNNKKFRKLAIIYDIYTRNKNVMYSSTRDKEFYLNYPVKIKNYTIDEYYRPFVKPYLNFFNNKYIKKSHPYMKKNILKKPQFKEDNFYSIDFCRILPCLSKKMKSKKILCENIKNKGNVFGYILLYNNFLIFINSPEEDERKSKDLQKRLDFIYSIREDIIVDTNKYIIIFYKDIKEVIKRRVCFNYIGYEIFLKDDRSYFFNFFSKESITKVYTSFEKVKNIEKENLKLYKKNNSTIIEEKQKSGEKNIIKNINFSINLLNNNAIYNSDFNFKIIEDPISYFSKLHIKNKYKKGEISNFNYLLLLNKYSSRTYNDYNQYLIFPLLFLDVNRKVKRDLSKAVSLNKEDSTDVYEKAKGNLDSEGYHFNQHYSTGGFILYYLLRLVPFTYSLIEFQSGKFDLPARLFSSMKSYLLFFTMTHDNREFCPEFFFNYEFLLNLNHNDFGEMALENKSYFLNNFDSNKNEVFVQFIIYLRNMLEEADICPWIDNIFGSKQNNFSDEQPNSFPHCTYEEYCEFEKIKKEEKPLKEKIELLQERIDILKFGITPAKIFNKPHKKVHKQNNDFEDEINFEKKEKKIVEIINEYLGKKSKEKEVFYLINNHNKNANEIELILKFNSRIDKFKLKIKDLKYSEESFEIKEQINMEPNINSFCEIAPGLYCLVRNKDKTIQFVSKKNISQVYQWTCIVTAIEPFIQTSKNDNNIIKKVFLGDEKGYLHLMEIEYDIQQYDKSYSIKSVNIKQSIKAHNSLIKGITYNEKLNAVISWSDEGVISINNDYSLNFLNIISIGKNWDIQELIISKFDIIVLNALNKEDNLCKIFCLTLSGIRVSSSENAEKIVKCYADEKILVIISNGNIFSHTCYDLYELSNNTFSDYIDSYEELNVSSLSIKYCTYYPKIKKLLLIYTDNNISFQKIDNNFL